MSTALYRRYRPETFAEVIGQEHVTEPLSVALTNDRINHAYLFSGPRGCGKTSSARILARCLNCAEGPTPTPCGVCDSCVGLARGGPGSLDVVEIDAASHGGVDDARELRERAAFAPARDRYKVFIIDEAHMVSSQGFNALLKLVEEPPEHVRFIFATTEPEKVLGTIRSRTHHYPFRLVPPERLQTYLGTLCEQEGVAVGTGVLPLVVRAGAGSVRDSLSVLDQLMAGAGPEGLDYARAVSLLGFTDSTLLDDVVDALAAGDGAVVFTVIDRVVQTGHDPRRFVEDLLERLRDLLVLTAVRDRASAVLRGLPEDQLSRMENQASRFGAGELSRAADVSNAALTEMTGATSPRLQLELLMARLLLPDAEDAERGVRARIDRLEKRVGVAGGESAHPQAPAPVHAAPPAPAPLRTPPAQASSAPAPTPPPRESGGPSPAEAAREAHREMPSSPAAAGAPAARARTAWDAASSDATAREGARPEGARSAGSRPEPTRAEPTRSESTRPEATRPEATRPEARPQPPTAPSEPVTAAPAAPGAIDTETVRRRWPEVLEALSGMKRATWSLMSQHAQVIEFADGKLIIGFGSPGLAGTFTRGAHKEFLRQALIGVLGLDCGIDAVVGDRPPARGGAAQAPAAAPPAPAGRGATQWTPDPAAAPSSGPPAGPGTGAPTAAAPVAAPGGPSDGGDVRDVRDVREDQTGRARTVDLTAAEARAGQPAGGRRPTVTNTPPDIPLPDEPPPDDDEAPFPDGQRGGRGVPSRSTPVPPRPAAAPAGGPASPATPAAPATAPAGANGSASNGSASSGSASSGSASNGSASNGSASNGSASNGPAARRPVSNRPDSTRPGGIRPASAGRAPTSAPGDDEPSRDDLDVEGSDLVGAAVVEQLLGGRVIEERSEFP